jgi:Holliday junction DNA helicase RuvA
MYEYIKGILTDKGPAQAVVEACGVGYALFIPLSTYEKLPLTGETVKLLCHHYVREDIQRLYGFLTSLERDIFLQLIGVSNIGPKTAMSILSGITPQDLVACVNSGDPSRLRKISGVGDKTAARLIVELKGKLSAVPFSAEAGKAQIATTGKHSTDRDQAFAAMVSLGYAEKQVASAFNRVESVIDKDAKVEEWIKKALQVI